MKKKEPKLIFRQFRESWNKKRIKEILKIKNGKSQKKIEDKNGKYPILATGGVIGHTNSYLYDKESILIGRKGTIDKPTYMNYPFWTVDTLFYSEIKKDYDAKFIYGLFQTIKWKKYNTSTGVPSLTSRNIENILIYSPQTLNEQQKIGSFFEKLDQLIQLQSDKLEHLKLIKKAYLQKMFPKNNKNVPKIRFNNVLNEWKEINLNSLILKSGSGGTPSTSKLEYYNGNIPFLSITDITKSNGSIKETEKHITKLGLNNSSAWIVPEGSITLSMYASVGKVAKTKIKLATSQAFFNMIYNERTTSNFMYYVFQLMNYNNYWEKLISTGTQKNLNATKIKKLKINIPKKEEQNKIYNLFNNLDQQITLQQQKLDNLKQQKKAYLQKMFI